MKAFQLIVVIVLVVAMCFSVFVGVHAALIGAWGHVAVLAVVFVVQAVFAWINAKEVVSNG